LQVCALFGQTLSSAFFAFEDISNHHEAALLR